MGFRGERGWCDRRLELDQKFFSTSRSRYNRKVHTGQPGAYCFYLSATEEQADLGLCKLRDMVLGCQIAAVKVAQHSGSLPRAILRAAARRQTAIQAMIKPG
ncbi:hypothetical protein DPEC_G00345640 [Dallia pectoralis]|uniref:Uncharacterized protein n=1 Tax=Dallia pectoralis TaxID=75939 RepID=A0ACC2F3T7_DALPE|nr:hypothetical protein DPEC_G00345640 [Dallia pectoralis]